MAKVEKVSIALTSDLLSAVRAAVASGDYASNSEVLREALREWRERREGVAATALAENRRNFAGFDASKPKQKSPEEIDRIVKEIQARWAQYPPIDMKEMDDWLYDENGLPH